MQHLESAQDKLHTELSSLRTLHESSMHHDTDLLRAIQSFAQDKSAFETEKGDHERTLRERIDSLQERLEKSHEDTKIADAKVVMLDKSLEDAAERVRSFAARYRAGGQLVRCSG